MTTESDRALTHQLIAEIGELFIKFARAGYSYDRLATALMAASIDMTIKAVGHENTAVWLGDISNSLTEEARGNSPSSKKLH